MTDATPESLPRFRRRKLQKPGYSERDMEIMRAHGWEVDEALQRTNPKDRSAHYTYLVGSYGSLVKIGHSGTPKRRLGALQNGSPQRLYIVKTWKLPRERAVLMERQLHTAFAWASAHGEWFEVPSYAVEPVGNLFAADRIADALRLAELLHALRDNDREQDRLRRAWYYASGSPKERRAAEVAGKALLPAVERAAAVLKLEALDLGYEGGVGIRQYELDRRRAHLEALVAA